MAANRGRERPPPAAALVGETDPDLILLIIDVVMGDLRCTSDDDIRDEMRWGDRCADLGRPPPPPINPDGEVTLSRRFTNELKEHCISSQH